MSTDPPTRDLSRRNFRKFVEKTTSKHHDNHYTKITNNKY